MLASLPSTWVVCGPGVLSGDRWARKNHLHMTQSSDSLTTCRPFCRFWDLISLVLFFLKTFPFNVRGLRDKRKEWNVLIKSGGINLTLLQLSETHKWHFSAWSWIRWVPMSLVTKLWFDFLPSSSLNYFEVVYISGLVWFVLLCVWCDFSQNSSLYFRDWVCTLQKSSLPFCP